MQTQAAIGQGILLALESAGLTLIALALATLTWLALVLFDGLVLYPLLERQPRRGLLRGLTDWAEERWQRWRSGGPQNFASLRRRLGGALFAAFIWCFCMLMLYELVSARTAAVLPESEDADYLPVLVGLMIVWVAGPWQFRRGLRVLPYPVSETHPTTSYLAAEHGFDLPLPQRYGMAWMLNLLRLSRIIVVAFLCLCIPEAATIADAGATTNDDSQGVTAAVYFGVAALLAYATIKAVNAVLLPIWVFEQIDVLLAAHNSEALPNSPKHPRKKPQIGGPMGRIQKGIDKIAHRSMEGRYWYRQYWYGQVLEAVADRFDVFLAVRDGSRGKRLTPEGIDLLERAGAIIALGHGDDDTDAVMALAGPIGVVDADERVVRVERRPPRPSRLSKVSGRLERGWGLVGLIMAIATTVWALIAAITGEGTWGDFMSRWG